MKKQLFLLSALALVGTALTSCNKGFTGEAIKVGLICLHGETSTYDKNFIDAFNAAIKKTKSQGYVEIGAIKRNIEEDQRCQTAAEEFADDEYKLILTDSFGHDAQIKGIVNNYKDVTFSCATGTQALIAGASNYHNAFASIYEGRYLAGVAAGEYLLEHNHTAEDSVKVGYVGAFPYAEVISGYTSWFLGVRSIMKNATMEVKYTNSWYDQEVERTTAESLIDSGCVLISQHADSMGAPDACKDRNIPNVSYNMNTVTQGGPSYANTYVAHSKINWEPYYENIIKAVATGKKIDGEKDQNWTGTLANGSVEYEVSSTLINSDGQNKIKEVEKKLKNGSLKVFDTSTFTVFDSDEKGEYPPTKGTDFNHDENGHLTSLMADIKDEGDYVRDTEIVKDGVVQESVYRSAPAFDLIIDGITIL